MTIREVKNSLIHKIVAIHDASFLNAIKTIVDTKSETMYYRTSEEQKTQIQEGIDQIEKGMHFTNTQVDSEIQQWLKERKLGYPET